MSPTPDEVAPHTNFTCAALIDLDLVVKCEGGDFARLDRIIGGELQGALATFNNSLWPTAA